MVTRFCSMSGSKLPDEDSDKAWVKDLALFSVITLDLLAYSAAGIGVGYLAWANWSAPWWVLLITSSAGLFLAFYRIYVLTRRGQGSTRSK